MVSKNNEFTNVDFQLFTINGVAKILHVSRRTIYRLISSGSLKVVTICPRMKRISLQDLIAYAEGQGYQVEIPSSLPLYNNKETKGGRKMRQPSKPETGAVNKTAKCRKTPKAGDKAPEGVTHDTHYTMAEVLSKFNIKYGRFYEIRNRYLLKPVHAWGTTCFRKEDVDQAILQYDEEQGRDLSNDWYSCFDIMKLFGLGKTQVRRFAETHGVRIKQVKGGRANYYLKADWDEARKQAAKKSSCVKNKRK